MMKASALILAFLFSFEAKVFAAPGEDWSKCKSYLTPEAEELALELFHKLFLFNLFKFDEENNGKVPESISSYFGYDFYSEPNVRFRIPERESGKKFLTAVQMKFLMQELEESRIEVSFLGERQMVRKVNELVPMLSLRKHKGTTTHMRNENVVGVRVLSPDKVQREFVMRFAYRISDSGAPSLDVSEQTGLTPTLLEVDGPVAFSDGYNIDGRSHFQERPVFRRSSGSHLEIPFDEVIALNFQRGAEFAEFLLLKDGVGIGNGPFTFRVDSAEGPIIRLSFLEPMGRLKMSGYFLEFDTRNKTLKVTPKITYPIVGQISFGVSVPFKKVQ